MNRIGAALGWSILGLFFGALIGAVAGFVMGVIRIENVAQAAQAGAAPVGLIGALGAFSGRMLESSSAESDHLTVITTFFGAIVGALAGVTLGKALGADLWLLDSIQQLESASIQAFLLYHIDLFGGPHVVAGAFLGILSLGFLDVFFGNESSFAILLIAVFLTPVVAIIAALIGQIDWGAAIVIVVATGAIFYMLMKSGGGGSSSTGTNGGSAGSGANFKGKGKPKA